MLLHIYERKQQKV